MKETVNFSDSDKFTYLFEHTCSIYKDALTNQKYLDHSLEIQAFLEQIQMRVDTMTVKSRYEPSFYSEVKVSTIQNDEYTNQMLNEYVLEIAELIQMKLNPNVQKILRDIEYRLICVQQFLLTASLCKNLFVEVFEDLPLYQKHKDFGQMHAQMKLITELMKALHAEYVHEKCPQCFVNGKSAVTQLSNSYEALFELQQRLYPQRDYTIRPDDSVHNFKTMTFVRSEKNAKLIEQIVSGAESLRVNAASPYEIQHVLEQ